MDASSRNHQTCLHNKIGMKKIEIMGEKKVSENAGERQTRERHKLL